MFAAVTQETKRCGYKARKETEDRKNRKVARLARDVSDAGQSDKIKVGALYGSTLLPLPMNEVVEGRTRLRCSLS